MVMDYMDEFIDEWIGWVVDTPHACDHQRMSSEPGDPCERQAVHAVACMIRDVSQWNQGIRFACEAHWPDPEWEGRHRHYIPPFEFARRNADGNWERIR